MHSASTGRFDAWLSGVTGEEWAFFIKRLAANDTLATGSHQAGPYLPNVVVFELFPEIKSGIQPNPDSKIPCVIDSHDENERLIRVVWYNQKTRNECHMTGWGGKRSPILNPESTGSIAVFAFHRWAKGSDYCRIWVCDVADEDFLIDRLGPVEPGQPLYFNQGKFIPVVDKHSCWLTENSMPQGWLDRFPSAQEILDITVCMRKLSGKSPDQRLISRRDCEYSIFRSIEQLHVLPRIRQGFDTVDAFIEYSNSVTNRRKSRAGRSLELHLKGIFDEEGVSYAHGEVSEANKRPDFLFPSVEAYRSGRSPLFMLAAKTTCKDRWRQILNEADKIHEKHLVTLQEGISVNQFNEMKMEGVKLVVPAPLQKSYPKEIRADLLSLAEFAAMVNGIPV